MTANWRKRGKGEDELKTVFCLSLGRAGTLELYFPFFFFFYHTVFTFFVPSTTPSLSHPCCLSLPPSLALWDNFKVKPFGQSASCKDLHHCFPFLSLLACVCNLSSVRARVSELNILSWPHTEQHTRTHSHTNSDQASSRVVFKNPLHSPWGTEALCTRRCCVCVCRVHPQTGKPPIVPAVSSMFQTCCGISALHGDLLRGGIWKCNVSTAQSLFNNSAFKWF